MKSSKQLWLLLIGIVTFPFLLGATTEGTSVLERGALLEKQGKMEEALNVYLPEISVRPSKNLYLATGSLMGKLKQYQQGAKLMDRAYDLYPKDPAICNLAALLKLRFGDEKGARKLWQVVLTLQPGHPQASKWLAHLDGATNEKPPLSDVANKPKPLAPLPQAQQEPLAQELMQELRGTSPREVDQYREKLREIIFRCPEAPVAPDACWKLANLYLYAPPAPDHVAAVEILEHLIRIYPASKWCRFASNRLSDRYRQDGQFEKLLQLSEEVLKQKSWNDEEHACWMFDKAESLLELGRNDEGVYLLKEIAAAASKAPIAAGAAQTRLESFE